MLQTFRPLWIRKVLVQKFPASLIVNSHSVFNSKPKDVKTVVKILANRSNSQRQTLAGIYKSSSQKELDAGLKKVLSGDVLALVLGLMMKPRRFDAHRLRRAMEGLGTDEDTLLEILCTRTPQQMSEIRAAYSQEFKRDLEKDLMSETSGDFAKLLVALLKKKNEPGLIDQDVNSLCEELKQKKVVADVWIKILTSRNPEYLSKVLDKVEFHTGESAEVVVGERFTGVLSGDFRKGLKTLVQCIQNQYLYLSRRIHAMTGPVVQGVMVSHCEVDLLGVRVAYLHSTGSSLYSALQTQFRGEHLQALLALCRAED